jgi:hypothetical protein
MSKSSHEHIDAADFAALVRAGWTERQFTDEVIALALGNAWRAVHFRPARTAHGWRTALQGDGEGFNDVLALRGPVIVAAELKVKRNKPTPAQLAWLKAWEEAGALTFVWYPRHWQQILETLA